MKTRSIGRLILVIMAAVITAVGISGCLLVPVPFPVWDGHDGHHSHHEEHGR
jgi:hypothetical protein